MELYREINRLIYDFYKLHFHYPKYIFIGHSQIYELNKISDKDINVGYSDQKEIESIMGIEIVYVSRLDFLYVF